MPFVHTLTAIGAVHSPRTEPVDDDWDTITSTIELDPEQFSADVVTGLGTFSHIDVVFVFHRVDESSINASARHPRGRSDWPLVGIFAQRARGRPNRLGVTTCELVAVDGLRLTVRGLDAIDGTPVVDIKPHVREFAPRTPVRQPEWIGEVLADYWKSRRQS